MFTSLANTALKGSAHCNVANHDRSSTDTGKKKIVV